jgi:hypothetical protein
MISDLEIWPLQAGYSGGAVMMPSSKIGRAIEALRARPEGKPN